MGYRVVDYKTLKYERYSSDELDREVKKHLKEGWELYGDPNTGTHYNNLYLVQTMIKVERTEDEEV